MELTIKAIGLLSTGLQYDGTKEFNPKTKKEEFSSRRLNGEESSQRRHFSKAVESALKEYQEKWKEIADKHNGLVKEKTEELKKENPREKEEEKEVYDKRIDIIVAQIKEISDSLREVQGSFNELDAVKHTFEITEETKKVCKKYFEEWGDKVGFEPKDDDVLEELEEALK